MVSEALALRSYDASCRLRSVSFWSPQCNRTSTPLLHFRARRPQSWNGDATNSVDADGKLLDTRPRLILHEVPFSLTVAEISLQEKVKLISGVLNGLGDIIVKSLLRSLQSSPPALEGVLRRLMGKLAANEGLEQPAEFLEDEGPEGLTNLQTPASSIDEVVRLAGEALESIDNVSVDLKLSAFGDLLNRVIGAKTFAQRICVITDYVATLFYLARCARRSRHGVSAPTWWTPLRDAAARTGSGFDGDQIGSERGPQVYPK